MAERLHCSSGIPDVAELPPGLGRGRTRAILQGRTKWVNRTVLHYAFFGTEPVRSWAVPEAQRKVLRESFAAWKALGIGLEFEEVDDRAEAEVRIGFEQGDGSWSAVGRDVLARGVDERTMNLGWDLTTDYGRSTALHEIGHTLGLKHEHQNPFAGIVWDEPKVYAYFAGPPNRWPPDKTLSNVLRKISTAEVEGSQWDPDSIMEYWFPAGLIKRPEQYADGLEPPGTISAADVEYIRRWYPGEAAADRPLEPHRSVPLTLAAGQQADFAIRPPASRRYQIATFGTADTVLVLFENDGGQLRYLAGDDDSGTDANARISARLLKGRRYVARLRLYWEGGSGQTSLMYW